MRKSEELKNPNSCMNRAYLTEMTFVLLARDIAAPDTIREWCRLRCLHGRNTPKDEQIQEALACADAMEADRKTYEITRGSSRKNADRIICSDCPPVGYPTDSTRCHECPRSVA